MNKFSLYQSEEFKSLFEQYKHQHPDALALKLSASTSFKKELIQQVQGWQKSKEKLPLWHTTSGIIFPPKINLEQCSSETTAKYKSRFYKGKIGIDLTGGFGIDSYFFSKNFEQFYYIEPNEELLKIVQHNFEILGVNNIKYIHKTAEEFLKSFTEKADFIYIDPSRRDEHNRKLSAFKNTQPDVIELLEEFKNKSKCLLIKASPMLDIKQGIEELKHVSEVKVIATNNECKEILFELHFEKTTTEATLKAVDIKNEKAQEFSFNYSEEENATQSLSEIESYLYEPSAAIIKSGAFKIVTKVYPLKKLHINTHLYTSHQLIQNFQGRVFLIKKILAYKKEHVITFLNNAKKANISTRNFKDSTEIVKKKLALNDGGDDYIFACTDINNKPVIILCNKVY